ncbi:MAG: preprotein translocase subunit SecG [Oscillospiraceae bacterium]|jgi:preprotein translocase subunit SecG
MSVWEIICGSLLLIVGIFIIIVVMLQESKQPGLSGSLDGGMSAANTSGRGKTSEAILIKLTKISAIAFFVITMAVNFVSVFFK